tara:strand:- start:64 stop:504 length:441 start_codon:yes stop_codon:yes gene_type:complete
MIQYWTTWNFIWYSGFKLKYYNLNASLKTSIITTALVGGYIVYIYPRRMKWYINDKKYNIPYSLLMTGDFIFHQYPLIDIIINNYDYDNICITHNFLPPILWYNTAKYILNGKMDKLYGLNMNKLLIITSTIAGGLGLFHHLIKNK